MTFWTEVWLVLRSLAPWLLLGTAIAGLLHGFLPRQLIRNQLKGRLGVIKSVLIGVPMPLCSCGVIPTGLGLKKDGASAGATVGFLISTPQTGVDSIFVSGSFLGWPFALFKVASAALTGVVGGWLTDLATPDASPSVEAPDAHEEDERRGIRAMVDHGIELLQSIWGWLVVGVLVSAAISVLVPQGTLASLGQLGPLGAGLAALAISLPLYVCATASVPIAAALVAAGLPPGAALVFLMAGPATNVATVGAIHRGLGGRVTGLYLGTIIVGSLGLGMLFDSIIDAPAAFVDMQHHGAGPAPWWELASVALLLALLARFAIADLRRVFRRLPRTDSPELRLEVEGMTCDGCASRLEKALAATQGVESAHVTFDPPQAVVTGSADTGQVRNAIEDAGFRPGA